MHLSDIPIFLKLIAMTFFALFPVVNPIGTSLIIRALTKSLNDAEYRKLSFKISTYMVGLLSTFLFLGPFILKLFGLSIPSVQVGGGLVLMIMGWKLLNSDDQHEDEKNAAAQTAAASGVSDVKGREFYPLTFPITSGPGSLSVILTLSAHSTKGYLDSWVFNYLAAFLGVLAMGVCVFFSFIYLPRLTSRLSQSGLNALSKLLAFVILCIGVEIVWNGIHAFILIR